MNACSLGTVVLASLYLKSQILTDLSIIRLHFSQTRNIGSDRDRRGSGQRVGTSGNHLTARSAFPDSYASSLDGVLSAKDASVRGVLGDFHLFDQFTQSRTITGTVLSGDSDLLRALSHGILLNAIW